MSTAWDASRPDARKTHLPVITLPVAPGEYAFLQLPRRLTKTEDTYIKHLIDVMSAGWILDLARDDEVSPVEEHAALGVVSNDRPICQGSGR